MKRISRVLASIWLVAMCILITQPALAVEIRATGDLTIDREI